jgi:mono/diheme cytochrome c family protein
MCRYAGFMPSHAAQPSATWNDPPPAVQLLNTYWPGGNPMWTWRATALSLIMTTTAMAHAQPTPAPVALDTGRALFVTFCASCHGMLGRGDGPIAHEWRRRPANLTELAKGNGGFFNAERVHDIVDGRAVKAHGTTEMPIWGDEFKWREGVPEDAIRARVDALVGYLETIQKRANQWY